MRWIVASVALLAGLARAESPLGLSEQDIVGTWDCRAATMQGPNFDVEATWQVTRRADHSYTSLNTSLVTTEEKPSITTTDQADGTWRLEGDVIVTSVGRVEFLSSSDAGIGKELGQQVLEAQIRKKSVYRARVIAFDGTTSRSVPVDPMHKQADVESTCTRR